MDLGVFKPLYYSILKLVYRIVLILRDGIFFGLNLTPTLVSVSKYYSLLSLMASGVI